MYPNPYRTHTQQWVQHPNILSGHSGHVQHTCYTYTWFGLYCIIIGPGTGIIGVVLTNGWSGPINQDVCLVNVMSTSCPDWPLVVTTVSYHTLLSLVTKVIWWPLFLAGRLFMLSVPPGGRKTNNGAPHHNTPWGTKQGEGSTWVGTLPLFLYPLFRVEKQKHPNPYRVPDWVPNSRLTGSGFYDNHTRIDSMSGWFHRFRFLSTTNNSYYNAPRYM